MDIRPRGVVDADDGDDDDADHDGDHDDFEVLTRAVCRECGQKGIVRAEGSRAPNAGLESVVDIGVDIVA